MGSRYLHLSLDERVHIEKGLDSGVSIRQIALGLGRSAATVSREVRRNRWRPSLTSAAYTPYRPAGLKTGQRTDTQYRASIAQGKAVASAQRSHQGWRMNHDELVAYVCDTLRGGWTPELISGRLPLDFPDDLRMRVSAETLYAWIYSPAQAWRGLREYLPRGHKKRRVKKGRKVHGQTRIPDRVSIHDRPVSVQDRIEFGHWEGDSIIGGAHSGGIHTEVERKTRYLAARKIDRVGAPETLKASQTIFTALPVDARKSVTFDNGSEFTSHTQLSKATGIKVFFADPYSSWQRGTNEHFNGRIRRYLPKKTSFTDLTQDELDEIVTEINNQPRKILGYLTPTEALHRELQSQQHHRVALQT